MHSRLASILAVSIIALAVTATASAAPARKISVSPRFGVIGDEFGFKGTGWQPRKGVRWLYDESGDGTFEQTGRFRPGRRGMFRLIWVGEDVVATHRMCFRQFDSRRRYRRVFLKCQSFTATQDRSSSTATRRDFRTLRLKARP